LDDVDVVVNIEKKRGIVKSANRMTALGAYPLERRSGEGYREERNDEEERDESTHPHQA
jgi:hypothetical protein